jgi:hypothetical protein
MTKLSVYLDGIGLIAPGLSSWTQAQEVLSGRVPYAAMPTTLPPVEKLPPAERRRVGVPVKLSMAIGLEAAHHAGADLHSLATVFSSTEADCDNTHAILEALASSERMMSPTRFHNSVHNAPSGYWSIATGSMQTSTSLNTYDATFSAGLLEAATQIHGNGKPCMLLAFDTAFSGPIRHLRAIPDAMGVALVLSLQQTPASLASLSLTLSEAAVTPMRDETLEQMRTDIPAARSLPLLELLAQQHQGTVVLDYLESLRLAVDVHKIA